MADISLTDAINEIRKLTRTFEALKRGEELLAKLSAAEQLAREASDRAAAADAKTVAAGEELASIKARIAESRSDAELIVKGATEKAAALLADAKVDADKLKQSVAGLVEKAKAKAALVESESAAAKEKADKELAEVARLAAAESDRLTSIRAAIEKLAKA